MNSCAERGNLQGVQEATHASMSGPQLLAIAAIAYRAVPLLVIQWRVIRHLIREEQQGHKGASRKQNSGMQQWPKPTSLFDAVSNFASLLVDGASATSVAMRTTAGEANQSKSLRIGGGLDRHLGSKWMLFSMRRGAFQSVLSNTFCNDLLNPRVLNPIGCQLPWHNDQLQDSARLLDPIIR